MDKLKPLECEVHNLEHIDFRNIDAMPYDWAVEFDEGVKLDMKNRDHEELVNYQKINGSSLAVPTLDHYLPMIYVLALQVLPDRIKIICSLL